MNGASSAEMMMVAHREQDCLQVRVFGLGPHLPSLRTTTFPVHAASSCHLVLVAGILRSSRHRRLGLVSMNACVAAWPATVRGS